MKNIKLIFIIFTICSISIRCGSKSREEHTFGKEFDTSYMTTMLKNENKEKIILLSIKYDIDIKVTENIIDEYLSKYDLSYAAQKLMMHSFIDNKDSSENILLNAITYTNPNCDFLETINDLSAKYNTPIKKIACLLIDYKIWEECEQKSSE
jgi:hypothetical protein